MRLNNFVSELLSVNPLKEESSQAYEFVNPREGWVLITTIAESSSNEGKVEIIFEPVLGGEIITRGGGQLPTRDEAMRYLPQGRYELTLVYHGQMRISSLIVRTIPEIIYANYPGDPHLKEFGTYDWEFLEHMGMLGCANVIITGNPEGDWVVRWGEEGKRVIQQVGVPGLGKEEEVNADKAYSYWSGSKGWSLPGASGLIADEFPANREAKIPAWSQAIHRLTRGTRDRLFYPYLGGEPEGLKSFVESLSDTSCRFAHERYLKEQPTEDDAQRFLDERLSGSLRRFKRIMPKFPERLILVLGLLCGPPESLNTNPSVNYKVFMDMQFHAIANDPVFEGIYGMEEYLASYADDEYLRWAAKLYRHYCLEGHRDRATSDPYILTHIRNPDFSDGVEGWQVEPAETDGIGTGRSVGLGWLQGRYPRDEEGDTFLWMRRSAKGPNMVKQIIRNLEPSRPYSLKMYAWDRIDPTVKKKHELSIRIQDVELIPEPSFQGVFATHPKHRIREFGDLDTYFSHFRKVFRPIADSATLVISDWPSENECGSIGQELGLNFVEIEPFFMEASGMDPHTSSRS